MRERPILFSAPMVRAILEGRKGQTRRILKPQPQHLQLHHHKGRVVYDGEHRMWCWNDLVLENICDFPDNDDRKILAAHCPYGKTGSKLWVGETFKEIVSGEVKNRSGDLRYGFGYKADGAVVWAKHTTRIHDLTECPTDTGLLQFQERTWKPSIHMPRRASRITLEIEQVRVERLQDISEEDAKAEGCDPYMPGEGVIARPRFADDHQYRPDYRTGYRVLWESINGKGSWDKNPWVFVICFKRVKP